MQKKILRFFILLAMLPLSIFAQIEYKEVETKGTGKNLQEAINNALVEAIGRVNGKSIDAANQLNEAYLAISKDGEESNASSTKLQQAYSEATKGVVASYDVLSENEVSADKWEVQVRAKIAKYKRSTTANRKRVALIPFRLSDQPFTVNNTPVDKVQVNRIMGQNFVTKLVQSRRFTILDREYIEETLGEKSNILSGNSPVEEMAKLGEELVADYIVVGTVENVSYKINEVKMQALNRVIAVPQGNIEINYRIIDVVTKQIKFSDYARFTIDADDISRIDQGVSLENPETVLCMIAADKIAKKVLDAIYPILILSVNGDSVTLNQGGDLINQGDTYDVFMLGEKMIDPYTKESLGHEEIPAGKIEITRVNPKMAYGKITSSDMDIASSFAPSRFLCRLVQEAASPAKKQQVEMEKKREERKKKRDENW